MPKIIPNDGQVLDLFGEHANYPGRYSYAVMGALLDRIESAIEAGATPAQVIADVRLDLEEATGEPVRKPINLDKFLTPCRQKDVLAAARSKGLLPAGPASESA